MANNVYVGNRYVPIFADPVEWDSLRTYEALTIVTYYGTSYTSRKPVPAGTPLSDREYWVVTGNYNSQVEAYRRETEELSETVTGFGETITGMQETIGEVQGDIADIEGDITSLGHSVTKIYDTMSDMIANFVESDKYCVVLKPTFDLADGGVYHCDKPAIFKWVSGSAYYENDLTNGGHAELVIPDFKPINGAGDAIEALPFIADIAYSYAVDGVVSKANAGPWLNDHSGIQCSQFINTLLYGVYYSSSKMANANNINAGCTITSAFKDNGTDLHLSANEMAHVCAMNGWLKETDQLCDIEVGDLIFWSINNDAGNWKNIVHVAMCVAKYNTCLCVLEVGNKPYNIQTLPISTTLNKPAGSSNAVSFSMYAGDLHAHLTYETTGGYTAKLFGFARIPYNAPRLKNTYNYDITMNGSYTAGQTDATEVVENTSSVLSRYGVIDLRGWTEAKNSNCGVMIRAQTHGSAYGDRMNVVFSPNKFNGGVGLIPLKSDGLTANGTKVQIEIPSSSSTDNDTYNLKGTLKLYS